jgi:hypothetical protein
MPIFKVIEMLDPCHALCVDRADWLRWWHNYRDHSSVGERHDSNWRIS